MNPGTKSGKFCQIMRYCIREVSPIRRKNDFSLSLNFSDPTSNSKFPKSSKSDSHRSQIECLRTQVECLRTPNSAAGTINTCHKKIIPEFQSKFDSRKQFWKMFILYSDIGFLQYRIQITKFSEISIEFQFWGFSEIKTSQASNVIGTR